MEEMQPSPLAPAIETMTARNKKGATTEEFNPIFKVYRHGRTGMGVTGPTLSKYEKTHLIGVRVQMLECLAQPLVDVEDGMTPFDIANREFDQGILIALNDDGGDNTTVGDGGAKEGTDRI